MAGKTHYEVDFYEGKGKRGLEYLGRDSHDGPVRTLEDIRRESILSSKGIHVHGVTKTQSEDVLELERFAEILIRGQGKRWRKPTPDHERAMRALLRKLYRPTVCGGVFWRLGFRKDSCGFTTPCLWGFCCYIRWNAEALASSFAGVLADGGSVDKYTPWGYKECNRAIKVRL